MKTILVVEDEEFLIDAYRVKFKSARFAVDIASDGEEAIQKIDANTYDLFILDLIMPKKNGMEVLAYIRSKPECAKTPVIIASNVDKKETLQDALKAGANDYFIKSETSLADILAIVEEYLF